MRTEAQIENLESNLAEARKDATAKCKEVEDMSKAYAYQSEKLMHAMRQASAQTSAAAATHADAVQCQQQLQEFQEDKAVLMQALVGITAECQSIQAAVLPFLKASKPMHPGAESALYNVNNGNPALHGSILISQAQEAVEVLKRDVASLMSELEQHIQGSNGRIGIRVSHNAGTQTDPWVQTLQVELEGKSLAFTAQGHRLADAQQQVHQLTVDWQHVHAELQLKQQQLEQLTTDHILEAERVGQACSDAAVMAQQIDALMAEAGVRKLELAEARADASIKADQSHMWKQQASKEAARVSAFRAGHLPFIDSLIGA